MERPSLKLPFKLHYPLKPVCLTICMKLVLKVLSALLNFRLMNFFDLLRLILLLQKTSLPLDFLLWNWTSKNDGLHLDWWIWVPRWSGWYHNVSAEKDVDDLVVSQCGLVVINCRTGNQGFCYFQYCMCVWFLNCHFLVF